MLASGSKVHVIGFRREGAVHLFAREATTGAAFGSPCEVPKPVRIVAVEFVVASLSFAERSRTRSLNKTV
jgi:hypothetical protein